MEQLKDRSKRVMENVEEKRNDIIRKWEEKSRDFIDAFLLLFGRDGRLVSTSGTRCVGSVKHSVEFSIFSSYS